MSVDKYKTLKYKNYLDIPIITTNTIKITFKTLIIKSNGPKVKRQNLKLFNELNTFYEKYYKKFRKL